MHACASSAALSIFFALYKTILAPLHSPLAREEGPPGWALIITIALSPSPVVELFPAGWLSLVATCRFMSPRYRPWSTITLASTLLFLWFLRGLSTLEKIQFDSAPSSNCHKEIRKSKSANSVNSIRVILQQNPKLQPWNSVI